jgi:hypothetical protein
VLPIHVKIRTKESEVLVRELSTEPHGKYPLIAWRDWEIPDLLRALGASPAKLLPGGTTDMNSII